MERLGAVGVIVAAALLLTTLTLAPAARADGDPASDVLTVDNVFLSLEAPSQSAEGRELEALATAAKRRGFPIKVAVIVRRTDLGTATPLYGRGQAYADFLGQELAFAFRGTLIVVMGGSPGGVGVFGRGKTPQVLGVASTLSVPHTTDTSALGEAAVAAVRRVAAAAGHPLPNVKPQQKSQSYERGIILAGALALAVIVAIAWPLRNRRGQRSANSSARP